MRTRRMGIARWASSSIRVVNQNHIYSIYLSRRHDHRETQRQPRRAAVCSQDWPPGCLASGSPGPAVFGVPGDPPPALSCGRKRPLAVSPDNPLPAQREQHQTCRPLAASPGEKKPARRAMPTWWGTVALRLGLGMPWPRGASRRSAGPACSPALKRQPSPGAGARATPHAGLAGPAESRCPARSRACGRSRQGDHEGE